MVQNWDKWLLHQVVVLPFRGTWFSLEKWINRNLMMFITGKREVLSLGRNSPMHHHYMLW